MNLVYVGNVQFEETEASGGLAVDPWGFDVLTREWAGAAYLLDGFLSTLGATVTGYDAAGNPIIIIMRGRRVRDTVYPQLFLTTISVSVERAFAKVSSSFRGVSDGRSPETVIEGSTKTLQVQLPLISDQLGIESGISSLFTYKAPSTTLRYWTDKQPTGARYKGRIQFQRDALQIVTQTGPPGPLVFFKGKTLTNNQASVSATDIEGAVSSYNAVIEVVPDDYTWKPISGGWWEVSETNSIILTPLNLANRGWVTQLLD